MGGNFSVPRSTALALGGFDENFMRVAYRFEAEFAHRWRQAGGRIWFEPAACLHHLKDGSGGTRSYGSHLTTWRPDHAVGAYYFSLRSRQWGELLSRPWRAVATRHHLRHPWHIIGTWLAEAQGLWWAWRLWRSGPKLIDGKAGGVCALSEVRS
jgi:GT2 family glycosyltransferase